MIRHHLKYAGASLLLSSALVACGETEENEDTAATETPVEAEEVVWEYEGELGAEHWGDLSPDFAACETGVEQSPIDLTGETVADAADVAYAYQPAAFEVVNLGHVVQANVAEPGSAGGITLDGERYDLLQFHAHTPSEHAIDGERADIETHLVHQNDAGELAVVGVLANGAAAESPLMQAFGEAPQEEEAEPIALDPFDASRLLPAERETFVYDGSLTTPPCTEGVAWLVMSEVGTVNEELVQEIEDVTDENARPLQELGDREIVLDEAV